MYLGNLILKKNQYPILSNIVDLQQKVTKKYFIVLFYMNILFEYILLILFIILKNQELYNLLRKFSNIIIKIFIFYININVIKKIDIYTHIYIYVYNQSK